ncbi:MAG TPA: prepilin-type N-terminal cleavage/methylation domain-containing protein, partial [Pirellulaceae bacterium]|nr:prepilin-type N-terminal cleavage/methylation domain-containing protein [Pirellulaceae bacterium]
MLFQQPDLARAHVSRRGITLLEVLISIGVTAIGILGVMSLIPLAGSQARKGQIAERSIVIGLAGVGEMQTRGMLNPNNWIDNAGNTNSNGYFVSPGALRPVCIDG